MENQVNQELHQNYLHYIKGNMNRNVLSNPSSKILYFLQQYLFIYTLCILLIINLIYQTDRD